MNQEKLLTIFIDTFVYLFTEIMKDKGYINCLTKIHHKFSRYNIFNSYYTLILKQLISDNKFVKTFLIKSFHYEIFVLTF